MLIARASEIVILLAFEAGVPVWYVITDPEGAEEVTSEVRFTVAAGQTLLIP